MIFKRLFWKWFGIVSTVLLAATALTPDTLRVPQNLRPWVFLTAILWIFVFCTGQFWQ